MHKRRTQHINSEHAPFNTRSHSDNNDFSMGSPPRLGSRASSVAGGGDAVGDATPPPPRLATPPPRHRTRYHPLLNGRPCDRDGNFLPPNAPPLPRDEPAPDDFSPYAGQADFELADLLYRRIQMSAGAIDELMQNWAAQPDAPNPPFADSEDLYNTIDATEAGHVPWQSFTVKYNRPLAPGDDTHWKTQEYSEMDFAPKQVFFDDKREYKDFMSGNWAWRQADIIVQDPKAHGSTFVPVILGSDKTTVSVATGQNEYYPLYMSNGLVHNGVRRAHRNAVTLIGFLAIPKTDRESQDSTEFRTFRRNLFHGSLRQTLQSLKPGMETPEVAFFGDGHYRRVVYGLGPYIADYPEQVLLACVVQGRCARCTAPRTDLDGPGGRRSQLHTEHLFEALDHGTMWDTYGVVPDVLPFTWDFPRADIYELLSPDLLHQVIKGTFKDHLITWVGGYLEVEHGKPEAKKIMADIDRRIAAVPPFPGLRRFPEGRGFKQWTGDDSKALMKVYLPAIEGHVPPQMLRALSAFLDFCYLVRRNVINKTTLLEIDAALARYYHERVIFVESGVCPDGFCLPRQHSLTHYRYLIQEFAAPNGLCSSITESKHIKAVKQPWRRSSRFQALGQMLTINDRQDKLAAARVDFTERGMMTGPSARPIPDPPAPPPGDDDDDGGPSDDQNILGEVKLAVTPVRCYPRNRVALSQYLNLPQLIPLIQRFLYGQDNPDHDPDIPLASISLDDCPEPPTSIKVFPSAVAKFFAPSDQSGIGGMLRERIRAVRSWRGGPPRYDCVFVEGNADLPGFRGLLAARVLLFLSFKYRGCIYPCALVTWFSSIGDKPCPDRIMDIIHVDTILRAAHLVVLKLSILINMRTIMRMK
ncbi:hypothetical protein R3P38DRAFT_3332062 [Favolaschia claudopus]|uniref:Uncharacterized protein n=1 Tax=Favolaschia claudopus TaxID=2862362 RepID=A0AAV9ZPD7_9AGAR